MHKSESPQSESEENISSEEGGPKNQQKMSNYEKQRLKRIEENKMRMEAMGLHKMANSFMGSVQKTQKRNNDKKCKKKIVDEDDDEYNPAQDDDEISSSSEEGENDDEFLISQKKVKRNSSTPKKRGPIQKPILYSDFVDDDDDALLQAIALSLQDSVSSPQSSGAHLTNTGLSKTSGKDTIDLTSDKRKENSHIQNDSGKRRRTKPISSRVQMTEDEMLVHFFHFDETGKGGFALKDVQRLATAHYFTWSENEMADMIYCFDTDGDGKINFDDFRKIVSRCNMLKGSDVGETGSWVTQLKMQLRPKLTCQKVIESHGSLPVRPMKPHVADEKAAVGKVFQLRSEKLTEPPTLDQAFAQLDVPNTPIGNVEYTAELKREGKLGLFLPRDRALRTPTAITLHVQRYFDGIYRTTHDSMFHLLQSRTEFSDTRIDTVACQLAIGACLMTYMKLRALIFLDFPTRYNSANLKRPKAITDDLPVVAPFAFAIQQLGAVNIANLCRAVCCVPVYPDRGHNFGIPTEHSWNPNKYAQAVEYARRIGLHFNIVDLKQKSGTAWWLLRQHFEEDVFELKLPYPEVNYTSAMAVMHTLFLNGTEADPSNRIFDLTPCGTDDFGYILRDPHQNINVSTFEVIDESAKEIVADV